MYIDSAEGRFWIDSTENGRTKRCVACLKEKDVEDFPHKKGTITGNLKTCRTCLDELKAQIKGPIKEQKTRYSRRSYAKKFVDKFKSMFPCADCKKKYSSICMDFDHVRGKVANISTLVNVGASMASLREEIKKCELVCSNCHRVRTRDRNIPPSFV